MAETVRYSGTTSTGTSIAGLLGVAFIILKLTGVIAWPWIWVLAPFWIPLALALFVGGLFLLLFGLAHRKPRHYSPIRHGVRR